VTEKEKCPKCGNEYKSLGQHWRYNTSHRPKISNLQNDIITGLMMGDACLDKCSKHPRIKVEMISKNYLQYLDSLFGCLTTGVSLSISAEEAARKNNMRNFTKNAKKRKLLRYVCTL